MRAWKLLQIEARPDAIYGLLQDCTEESAEPASQFYSLASS